jgi:hypothetical protein
MANRRIFDVYDGGKADTADEPLKLLPAELPDPRTIPPREWLYGTLLIRGFVTVLVAPGGTGKSAYAMAVVLAMVSNRAFLADHIFASVNGAIFNLDDPMAELNRRIAALMLHHRIGCGELAGRLFLNDAARGLTLAARDADGFTVAYPDEQALIDEIKANSIGVVVCDPFAESHTLEENSNPQMIKAAAAWRRVARETNCAIFLVHHVRKGEMTSIDAARGAKALTDSARVGLLMTTMSEAEAGQFNIPTDDRGQYVRLDDAKRNMAPTGKAKWFRLASVALDNGTDAYPNGDQVQALAPWIPPDDVLATAPTKELRAVLDLIRDGPSPGILYTATRRGGSGRWCGSVLCEKFGVTPEAATKLVGQWLNSGLLWEDNYDHPKWRRPTKGVRVSETLRPT